MKLEIETATKLKLTLEAGTETWGEREINQAKAGGTLPAVSVCAKFTRGQV
jgi:hypothetical protein